MKKKRINRKKEMEDNRNKKQLLVKSTLICMLLVVLFTTGCKIAGRDIVISTGVTRNNVIKIGADSVSEKETKVYLANFQNIYGISHGINLWEQNFKTQELTEYVRDATLVQMTKIVCMDQLAKDQGITLDETELNAIEMAANTYFQSLTKAELEYLNVSESEIKTMYQDYALANKVYTSLTGSINEEVSDDEARIMEALQIFVKEEATANEIEQKLSNGEDFLTLASSYNQKGQIDRTFGRGELPIEAEGIIFQLDNDAISGKITTTDGFYFFKCVNKFNQELTDANKVKIVQKREKAAFEDVYESFVAGLDKSMNESLWESINLQTDGTITTNSFFSVIDQALDL